MVLKDAQNGFKWRQDGEDEKGYFFVITDIAGGEDYGVTLIKDTGELHVNKEYVKTIPRDAFEAAKMRAKNFMALKQMMGGLRHGPNDGSGPRCNKPKDEAAYACNSKKADYACSSKKILKALKKKGK